MRFVPQRILRARNLQPKRRVQLGDQELPRECPEVPGAAMQKSNANTQPAASDLDRRLVVGSFDSRSTRRPNSLKMLESPNRAGAWPNSDSAKSA